MLRIIYNLSMMLLTLAYFCMAFVFIDTMDTTLVAMFSELSMHDRMLLGIAIVLILFGTFSLLVMAWSREVWR